MRAVLLPGNPDMTVFIGALCSLAGIDLVVAEDEAAVLLAAHQARPGDFLILDCSYREIALAGHVSISMVKVHIRHIKEKLGVSTRAHMIEIWRRTSPG